MIGQASLSIPIIPEFPEGNSGNKIILFSGKQKSVHMKSEHATDMNRLIMTWKNAPPVRVPRHRLLDSNVQSRMCSGLDLNSTLLHRTFAPGGGYKLVTIGHYKF